MSTHELKHLQTRKREAERAIVDLKKSHQEEASAIEQRKAELLQLAQDEDSIYQNLKKRLFSLENELSAEKQMVRELEIEIADLKSADRPITVSEHAIIRYLERVKGLDLNAIKNEILPPIVTERIDSMGDGCYPCGSHRIRVRERVVVTVLANDMVTRNKTSRKPSRKKNSFKSRPDKKSTYKRNLLKQEMLGDEPYEI